MVAATGNGRAARGAARVSVVEGDDMRVIVDDGRCQGHQMCAIAAPEVFGSDEYGNATVLIEGDVPDGLASMVSRAAGNCPEQAITISE
jgi:ferredoxin